MAFCFSVNDRRRHYRIIDTRFGEAFTVMCRTAARDRWIYTYFFSGTQVSVGLNYTTLVAFNVNLIALSVSAVFFSEAQSWQRQRTKETGNDGGDDGIVASHLMPTNPTER